MDFLNLEQFNSTDGLLQLAQFIRRLRGKVPL